MKWQAAGEYSSPAGGACPCPNAKSLSTEYCRGMEKSGAVLLTREYDSLLPSAMVCHVPAVETLDMKGARPLAKCESGCGNHILQPGNTKHPLLRPNTIFKTRVTSRMAEGDFNLLMLCIAEAVCTTADDMTRPVRRARLSSSQGVARLNRSSTRRACSSATRVLSTRVV